MQVLVELPVHVDSVFVPNRPYRKWRVLLQTACACSLLMDLLQMRTVGASPLFISEPEAFLAAYQGQWNASTSSSNSSKFAWCGGEYSQTDLNTALGVLLDASVKPSQRVPKTSCDPWSSDSWMVLRKEARAVLGFMHKFCQVGMFQQTRQRLAEAYMAEGHAIMTQAPEGSSPQPGMLFTTHKLYAAALVLTRLSDAHECGFVYEHMWELYSSQPNRAVYYLKLDLLQAHADAEVHDYFAGIAQIYYRDRATHLVPAFKWTIIVLKQIFQQRSQSGNTKDDAHEYLSMLRQLLQLRDESDVSVVPVLRDQNLDLMDVGASLEYLHEDDIIDDDTLAWIKV